MQPQIEQLTARADSSAAQDLLFRPRTRLFTPVSGLMLLAFALASFGSEPDTIGVTLVKQIDPTLQGTAIRVAQPEAFDGGSPGINPFEVNPFVVNQPITLFTWISADGSVTNFPNSLGTNSYHGNSVAGNFYGTGSSVAPGVAHVDNYEAEFFWTNVVEGGAVITSRVANQSFIFTDQFGNHYDSNTEAYIDSKYDTYAAQHSILFVSGAGNGGQVFPAATCYNGIGVGVYPGSSSYGPSYNGRCKPDIVSPGSGATSFSTPYVSGSAAVLMQAGNRGDGGANTNSASDIRTVKALLLNGAIKPSDWTNGNSTPLDLRYGAGVLNIFNSWQQLKAGQRTWIETTSHTGGVHPPGTNTSNLASLIGWDFNAVTNTHVGMNYKEQVNHYYLNATGSNAFTFTTTLTWNRQAGQSSINDLNLYLYNAANSNLVTCSTSLVDNVEHIFLPSMPPGRYDLQVWKSANNRVSDAETYALAFEAFNVSLKIAHTNTNLTLAWPLAPTGFRLLSTTNLAPPISWTNAVATYSINTNSTQNVASIIVNSTNQFFRLQRP